MESEQVRLDCLKVAAANEADGTRALALAKRYANFVFGIEDEDDENEDTVQ